MRCYECGYQNSSDARVCIKCGTKLSNAAASEAATPVRPNPAHDSRPVEPSAPSGGRPTIMGRAADAPAWDSGKPVAGGSPQSAPTSGQNRPTSVIRCSSCGYYPLRSEPTAASPCVNCGFAGDSTPSDASKAPGAAPSEAASNRNEIGNAGGKAAAASSPKTVRIDAFRIGEEPKKPGKVTLTDMVSGKQLEFEGLEIPLNRTDLDPENATISSSHHLTLHLDGDSIAVEDKSSNGATLVQAVGKVNVVPGSMLIVGNKVFRIDLKPE